MPYLGKRRVAGEDWEEEDPFTVYKEAPDPYERGSTHSLREREFTIHFRPTTAAQQFQRSDTEVAELFSSLVSEWRVATAYESNVERIILNSAYQRIIGLGPQVLPHVMNDLDETRDHWFWALMAIVGEDKASGQTSVGAATEAWLAWGRSVGIFNG
jgi:hypothetical protein